MAQPASDALRTHGIRRVLVVTLTLNLAVAAAKVIYGVAVGSLSIRADGFHSATDGLNNIVLLIGSWLAAAPPDREHPYGHKKLEVFAAGALGISLLVVAVDVAKDVILRLTGDAAPPRIDATAFVVLGGTLVVNVFVSAWEAREGRRLMSPGLVSDAAHTRSDILVTVGVGVTAVLTWMGWGFLDPIAGALVAGVIAMTGIRVVKENAGYLMDTNLVDPERVAATARAISGVHIARDVRSRGSPGGVFVDLTIEVDPSMTVEAAHDLAHHVEDAVCRDLRGVAGVSVHIEPSLPQGAERSPHLPC